MKREKETDGTRKRDSKAMEEKRWVEYVSFQEVRGSHGDKCDTTELHSGVSGGRTQGNNERSETNKERVRGNVSGNSHGKWRKEKNTRMRKRTTLHLTERAEENYITFN